MKLPLLTIIFALLLHSGASALQVIVWDRDLVTKLGYGELSGNKLSVQLVPDYTGAVVVLFAQSSSEKEKNTFSGLQSRYDGVLRGGQLSLDTSESGENVPFAKFLSTFKIGLSLQNAAQNITLPGLKVAPEPKK
jgi:hypothetical protein